MRSCYLKLNPIEVDSIFALGDANGDGEIDLEDFLAVMVPAAGFSTSFSSSSNTTFIQKTSSSFSSSSASSTSMSFNSAQDVKSIFRKFDKNGDGHLDRSEIKQMLQSSGKNASDQEVEQMFRQ